MLIGYTNPHTKSEFYFGSDSVEAFEDELDTSVSVYFRSGRKMNFEFFESEEKYAFLEALKKRVY